MKSDEAIEILKTWRITGDKAHEALDMAIEALAKDTNVPSNGCISREVAIDAAEKESQVDGAYGYMDTKSIVDLLNDLPSAQPEPSDVARDIATIIENEKDMRVVLQNSAQPEIIYCKDCKWKQGSECVMFADVRPFPDDFCSRAERKEDE